MTILKFSSGKEMLDTIKAGNDLYNPASGRYVWLYNDQDAIACGYISNEELNSIGGALYDVKEDSPIAFTENIMGSIYDDPENVQFCEDYYSLEWIDARGYIRPDRISLGTIEIDVNLVRDKGYDVYISYNGSSGEAYIKKSADEIGQVIADDIDCYAESMQDVKDIATDKSIPVPKRIQPVFLVSTDGDEISYVRYPSKEAASEALEQEFKELFDSLFDKDANENDITWEQEASYWNRYSAKLYTGETVKIWQVIY